MHELAIQLSVPIVLNTQNWCWCLVSLHSLLPIFVFVKVRKQLIRAHFTKPAVLWSWSLPIVASMVVDNADGGDDHWFLLCNVHCIHPPNTPGSDWSMSYKRDSTNILLYLNLVVHQQLNDQKRRNVAQHRVTPSLTYKITNNNIQKLSTTIGTSHLLVAPSDAHCVKNKKTWPLSQMPPCKLLQRAKACTTH